MVKKYIIRIIRKSYFQFLWKYLNHISRIGMNYWGGANIYYSGELDVMKIISKKAYPGCLIFDVGANVGHYSVEINKVIPNAVIYAFEPSKSTFRILCKNIEGKNRIKAINLGFGNKIEKRKLFSIREGDTTATLVSAKNRKYSESIEIDTLDSFFSNLNEREIFLLKVDVEGYDYYVLEGAKKLISEGKIHFIQFEFGELNIETRIFFKDFFNLLSSNYSLYRIVIGGIIELKEYNTELEVFSTANFLCINKKNTL